MSFSGTPLGQGRRLDHNTFLGKPPSNSARPPSPHRIVPTSYSYGAPTIETRSPPRPNSPSRRPQEQEEEDDESQSALAKFAKIKQREALASRPGGPKIITSPPKPDRWSVKDTSVILASALHIAAKNDMLPATNPNNAWASGVTRPNPVVPRSTSVEYEKETQTTATRRLAPPPNRLSRPPLSRKPLSKNASFRHVPDSEGEEDTPAAANGRGKSPFEQVVDMAKRALGPATYYVRQLSHEPEDQSLSTNGNSSHLRDTSYDYAVEEQEYQAAQQAKRAPIATHKRGRMSMDNRAYKPSTSDVESSEEDYDDDDKRKRRRKKKRNEPVGGPLTTLPVLAADKRKKRRKGNKSGATGPDDEESESDDPSIEIESTQAQQRTSVPRSLPLPPSRLSVPRSAPPHDTSMQDSSIESAEQGLDSIPEVAEEDLFDPPHKTERKLESRRPPRSSSKTRDSARFSVGGLLGRLVHGIIKGVFTIIKFVIYLITSVFFICGRILGTVYDVVLNRPVLWLRTVDLSPAAALVKYLTLGALVFGVWYGLRETDVLSRLPSLSFPQPSPQPIYSAPEVPAGTIAELAERLRRIEVAFSDSEQTRTRVYDNSHSELISRIHALESRLSQESKRAVEAELKGGKFVSNVKKEIEVLQAQLLAQQKQQQQQQQQHRVEPINDEEARAKLRALEERVGSVEGGVVELGKKLSSSASSKTVVMKSPSGQDVKTMLSEMVDSAVLLYSKDGIGKPDYAMHSGGARIVPSLTSPTFEIQPPTLRTQFFGLLTGNGYAVGRPPVTALHHETHSGYCWPFSGQQGQLGITLSAPTFIDEVTIDHIAKENAFDMRSAPRYMEVWGMVEGDENALRYSELKEEREKKVAETKERGEEVEEESYPASLPPHPPFIRIANFTYDIHSPKNIQTFPVSQEIRDKHMDFGIVVLRMLSNWGKEEFTCLYRFRVHGTRLGDMPIPEPIEYDGL